MFEFTRGGTKYFIRYGEGVSDNFLVCAFYDEDQNRYRWPVLRDTDDIPGVFKGDEVEFLKDFLNAVNKVLDSFFEETKEPNDESTPKERLTYLVKTKLSFNEETQHVELL